MRAWHSAAVAVAMMATHVAPAAGEALVSAGLGSSGDAWGGVPAAIAQSGAQLSRAIRLRFDGLVQPQDVSAASVVAPPRTRRIGTMLDVYPAADTGLRISAGMRFLSRRARHGWAPDKESRPGALLYAPALAAKLPIRNNIAHAAPAVTLGWITHLSDLAVFGIEAGTIMERGSVRHSSAAIAQQQLRTAQWSRTDPVAQVAFGMKF